MAAPNNLGEFIKDHLSDHPWPGCQAQLWGQTVTWMSDGIATMALTAGVLVAVILILARRRQAVPHGAAGALEVVVVFVRDMIARPALKERAYRYLLQMEPDHSEIVQSDAESGAGGGSARRRELDELETAQRRDFREQASTLQEQLSAARRARRAAPRPRCRCRRPRLGARAVLRRRVAGTR